jgi:hypothetical protein
VVQSSGFALLANEEDDICGEKWTGNSPVDFGELNRYIERR